MVSIRSRHLLVRYFELSTSDDDRVATGTAGAAVSDRFRLSDHHAHGAPFSVGRFVRCPGGLVVVVRADAGWFVGDQSGDVGLIHGGKGERAARRLTEEWQGPSLRLGFGCAQDVGTRHYYGVNG